mmetsp:Transcript_735/g.2027  ORF Transcript_735/g.2027 Transcript_735/m.2027 type:complete len:200 (+) Transcript_735:1128-1727(+)
MPVFHGDTHPADDGICRQFDGEHGGRGSWGETSSTTLDSGDECSVPWRLPLDGLFGTAGGFLRSHHSDLERVHLPWVGTRCGVQAQGMGALSVVVLYLLWFLHGHCGTSAAVLPLNHHLVRRALMCPFIIMFCVFLSVARSRVGTRALDSSLRCGQPARQTSRRLLVERHRHAGKDVESSAQLSPLERVFRIVRRCGQN